MTIKVYDQDGQEVGTVALKPEVFDIEPREAVVHQYVVNFLARQRQGNASTRTRSDVRGGGRKPWRQKGTGRARAGTIRSPLWAGGGTIFGPHPRWYGSKMPKKMKRLAIRSILSDKAHSGRIKVLEKMDLPEAKTRNVVAMMARLDLGGKKCLFLDEGKNESLKLSCRNLPNVEYCHAAVANGYDILRAEWVVFSRAGLQTIEEVFG